MPLPVGPVPRSQASVPPQLPELGEPLGWEDFGASPCPVHLLTEQGRILEANAAFGRLFGAPPQSFVGRHHAVLNTASVAANLRLWERIRAWTASRGYWQGVLKNRTCDGGEFIALARVYPMRAAGRRYFVCFQEPLTDAR